MTADVELLPCPFCGGRAKTKLPYVRCVDCGGQMCFGDGDAFDAAITAWNRRANVAHATAAKDAEIERLRAEVERLQGYLHEADRRVGEQFMAAQDANAHRLRALHDRLLDVKRAEAAEARAERLEEALQHSRWCRTCAEDGWDSCEDGRKNDALLREQENDDA